MKDFYFLFLLYQQLLQHVRGLQDDLGFQEVNTPVLVDYKLWEESGHAEKFSDDVIFYRPLNAGIAEHHPLVARALLVIEALAGVHTHGDVVGLLIDGGQHRAGLPVGRSAAGIRVDRRLRAIAEGRRPLAGIRIARRTQVAHRGGVPRRTAPRARRPGHLAVGPVRVLDAARWIAFEAPPGWRLRLGTYIFQHGGRCSHEDVGIHA